VSFDTLRVDTAPRVVVVTINRPDKLNALNAKVIAELGSLITDLSAAPVEQRVRALVLTGAGDKAFVAGADIAEMSGISAAEARAFSLAGHALGRALEEAPFAVIAAVNGFALGGGCELALCADFIYASDRAKFGQPELNLGLIPGFGGTQRLARRIGSARARELIYTGTPIDAARAFEIGLVNRVVPHAELMAKTQELAEAIAVKAPLAIEAAKRAILRGADAPLGVGNELEAEAFAHMFSTSDAREGMLAFIEKRSAKFEGK
jgi:enoyl-CoA hydratase